MKNKLIDLIIEFLGGKSNIKIVDHCVSRVRIYIKDKNFLRLSEISNIEDENTKISIIDPNIVHIITKPIGSCVQIADDINNSL